MPKTAYARSGIAELWLLSTTAADFFAGVGYAVANRSSASADLQLTTQFAELRPAKAVCMRKTLRR